MILRMCGINFSDDMYSLKELFARDCIIALKGNWNEFAISNIWTVGIIA